MEIGALPAAQFRLEPAAAVRVPPLLEAAAFWSVTQLAQLVRTRAVTSTALTKMYLARLKRYNPQINCVALLTEERALREASAADHEIAAGKYRGTLHGIPYGVKDIIAASGYPTSWGAKPLAAKTFEHDASFARPKSRIFARRSGVIMMLAGFRSRCVMRCLWAALTPSAIGIASVSN
jgi:hypothetical protein